MSNNKTNLFILFICVVLLAVAVHAQTQADIKAFNEFVNDCIKSAKKSPFKSAKIEVKSAPGMGRGTFATSNIKKDDIYMFMPWNCVMSDEKARAALGQQISSQLDDFLALIVYFLSEKAKGKKSFFYRYIKVLPVKQEFLDSLPYFWLDSDRDAIDLLKDSQSELYAGLYAERQKIRQQYEQVKRSVIDKFPKFFTPASAYSFEEFEHAYFTLNSRTIWVTNSNNKRALIPLLDNVNCKEGPDPSRVHTSTRSNEYDGAVVTKAPWGFGKGEQVFENYGSDNYNNFFYHGFTLMNNTHDCTYVKIQFGSNSRLWCLSRTKVPGNLQDLLREEARAKGYSNEFQLLKDIIQKKLAQYKTTLKEDKSMFECYAVPAKRQAIHMYLHEEKRVLQELIALF